MHEFKMFNFVYFTLWQPSNLFKFSKSEKGCCYSLSKVSMARDFKKRSVLGEVPGFCAIWRLLPFKL